MENKKKLFIANLFCFVNSLIFANSLLDDLAQNFQNCIMNYIFLSIYSALNPVIYGFMSKSFRESFYKAVCAAGSCLRWESSQMLEFQKSHAKHFYQSFYTFKFYQYNKTKDSCFDD